MKQLTYWLLALLAIGSLALFGCDSANKVHTGDTATIEYVATFPDGTVFQSSGISFVVGKWEVIAGLDEGVLGMKAGKTKKITITADKWYGDLYNPMKVQKISKLIFDKIKIDIKNGSFQKLGDTLEGVIKWMEKDKQGNELVLFDINPRETRDTLVYKVTLVSKTP